MKKIREEKKQGRFQDNKVVKSIRAFDSFCMKYKIYLVFIVLVILSSFVLSHSHFFTRKQIRNYSSQENYFSRQVVESRPLQFTFEAKSDHLSKISIELNKAASRLSSSDKATLTIYEKDNLNEPLFSKSAYIYSPSHSTIDVYCDNLSLDSGDMYYAELRLTHFSSKSVLYLKMHNVSNFNQLGTEEDVQADIPVGMSYVPNITYQYAKISYLSIIVHCLIALSGVILLFWKKWMDRVWVKELLRAMYLPLVMYLFMELLNVARWDGMQFMLPFTWKHYLVFVCGILIMQILYLFFYGLTGRGWISILIVTVLIGAIGITSHVKIVMRGDAFVPWDIYAAGMAASIGSKYYFRITWQFIVGILYLLSIFMLIRVTATPPRKLKFQRFSMAGSAVLAGLLLSTTVLFNKPFLKKANVSYALYPPLESYNVNGTLTAFVVNLNNLSAKGGSDNSPEAALDMQNRYVALAENLPVDTRWVNPVKKPNVICIMSESYGDLRNIRDIDTSEPVMPFYDSLLSSTIHGKLCVSIFAGGTCNTEFEFLTGCSVSGLLAGSSVYTFYVNDEMPSALPYIYRQNGYQTLAIHPFDREWWDRDEAYPLLGFDRFLSDEDFTDPKIVRRYISDQSAFERIVSEYENRDLDKPMFTFCVTMQNHADYSQEYDNMAYDIHLQNMEKDYPYTEQYLSLLRESDDALKYLIEYFENVDEPTIIVFFGDHYPTLDNGFYDELLGTDLNTITAQESLPLYQVPYFVWANYNIRCGNGGVKSPNFLGQNLLDLCGLPSPDARACLRVLDSRIGAINALAVYDRFGDAVVGEQQLPDDIRTLIEDYNFLQYDLIFQSDEEEDE